MTSIPSSVFFCFTTLACSEGLAAHFFFCTASFLSEVTKFNYKILRLVVASWKTKIEDQGSLILDPAFQENILESTLTVDGVTGVWA